MKGAKLIDTDHDFLSRVRPDPFPFLEAGVKPPSLTYTLAERAWRNAKVAGGFLQEGDELLTVHVADCAVINHSGQGEISHWPPGEPVSNHLPMEVNQTFRVNLLAAMRDAGISAAELSRRANMNARMVKDIEEGRSQSPKLSTVFALCKALGRDPGEMLGLGSRVAINQELAAFLQQYDADDQERLLAALRSLPGLRP